MSDWRPVRSTMPGVKVWQREVADGHLTVLVSRDDGLWHVSISHRVDGPTGPVPGRYPSWDEIKAARYRFGPANVAMVMVLPPVGEYVNVHPTTFHLWESRESWG